MLEFKLVAAQVLGKPKLAIALSSIQAEPDATRGVWCGSRGLDDIFIITNTMANAVEMIHKLNQNLGATILVDPKIQEYLKG